MSNLVSQPIRRYVTNFEAIEIKISMNNQRAHHKMRLLPGKPRLIFNFKCTFGLWGFWYTILRSGYLNVKDHSIHQ